MKIVYFISSYQAGDQLLRLVRSLRAADPAARVVVHHDVFACPAPAARLAELGAQLITSDHPVVWGDMSLEAIRWRVFAELLDGPDFDHVVLLSEQDYPVAPPSALAAFLDGADAVVDGRPVSELRDADLRRECGRRNAWSYVPLPSTGLARQLPVPVRDVLRRVRLWSYMAANKVQKLVRFYFFPEALGLSTRIGVRRSAAAVDAWGPLWFSSAWYSLSRAAVEHVVGFVRDHPDFARAAARSVIPLESATATIVGNAPHLVVRDASLHHIRWSDPLSGRPDEFGTADLDELIGSGRFFARKFRRDESDVLDILDRYVSGAESWSTSGSGPT